MPSYREPVYGFNSAEMRRLWERYRWLRDNTWEDFNDFLRWASETKVFRGAFLLKKDESKPHGPDNSYWDTRASCVSQRKWNGHKIVTSPFCEGCARMGENGCGGCEKWEAYFVGNWNEHIHVDLESIDSRFLTPERHTFQYEHPDLIREGIV